MFGKSSKGISRNTDTMGCLMVLEIAPASYQTLCHATARVIGVSRVIKHGVGAAKSTSFTLVSENRGGKNER